jgi:hypothetical protein
MTISAVGGASGDKHKYCAMLCAYGTRQMQLQSEDGQCTAAKEKRFPFSEDAALRALVGT